jgi:hypothetical protein
MLEGRRAMAQLVSSHIVATYPRLRGAKVTNPDLIDKWIRKKITDWKCLAGRSQAEMIPIVKSIAQQRLRGENRRAQVQADKRDGVLGPEPVYATSTQFSIKHAFKKEPTMAEEKPYFDDYHPGATGNELADTRGDTVPVTDVPTSCWVLERLPVNKGQDPSGLVSVLPVERDIVRRMDSDDPHVITPDGSLERLDPEGVGQSWFLDQASALDHGLSMAVKMREAVQDGLADLRDRVNEYEEREEYWKHAVKKMRDRKRHRTKKE